MRNILQTGSKSATESTLQTTDYDFFYEFNQQKILYKVQNYILLIII